MRLALAFALVALVVPAVAQTAPPNASAESTSPRAAAAGAQSADQEKAARLYRELLEKEIGSAREHAKLEISAASSKSRIDAEDAKLRGELEVLQLQCEAMAFDAGMLPRLPEQPTTPAAAEARAKYRRTLEQQEEIKVRRALLRIQQADVKTRIEGLEDQLALEWQRVRIRRVLAAFDAGFALNGALACGISSATSSSGTSQGRLP